MRHFRAGFALLVIFAATLFGAIPSNALADTGPGVDLKTSGNFLSKELPPVEVPEFNLGTARVYQAPPTLPLRRDFFYSFGTNETSAVVSTPLGTLTGIFGRPEWKLETSTFVGSTASGSPLAGFAATFPLRFSNELSFFGGPAFLMIQGEKPSLGAAFGFRWET